ncbi:MAG: DUF2946 family protein [Betaproteobacteria bacterium]
MAAIQPTRKLARLVLAWFMLALGVAVATPLVKPQSWKLVCSASGSVKLLNIGDDGTVQVGGHQLECPLCWLTAAPPPDMRLALLPQSVLQPARMPVPRGLVAVRVAPPMPARGPPLFC